MSVASMRMRLDGATRVIPLGIAMGMLVVLMNFIDNVWVAAPFLVLLGALGGERRVHANRRVVVQLGGLGRGVFGLCRLRGGCVGLRGDGAPHGGGLLLQVRLSRGDGGVVVCGLRGGHVLWPGLRRRVCGGGLRPLAGGLFGGGAHLGCGLLRDLRTPGASGERGAGHAGDQPRLGHAFEHAVERTEAVGPTVGCGRDGVRQEQRDQPGIAAFRKVHDLRQVGARGVEVDQQNVGHGAAQAAFGDRDAAGAGHVNARLQEGDLKAVQAGNVTVQQHRVHGLLARYAL